MKCQRPALDIERQIREKYDLPFDTDIDNISEKQEEN